MAGRVFGAHDSDSVPVFAMKQSRAPDAKSTTSRPKRSANSGRPWWQVKSDKAICSQGCGARCCKGSFISLTREEAELMPQLAKRLAVPEPEIVANERSRLGGPEGPVQEFIMYALPCTFLSKSNLCQSYTTRPAHCREFPDQTREWCPLSWKRFGDPP